MKKDIHEDIVRIREDLCKKRKLLGPNPLSDPELRVCESFCARIKEDDVHSLNKVIDNYNLQVPMLRAQMCHYQLDKEADKVLRRGEHKGDTNKKNQP